VDATYKLIKAVEKCAAAYADPPRVVICIQTDGNDNASTEYSFYDLNKLVGEKAEAGWQFNFLSVGVGRPHVLAACMGIPSDRAMSYGENAFETRCAFTALAENTLLYVSRQRHVTCFTHTQRENAGDMEGLRSEWEREGVYVVDERGAPQLWIRCPDPHPPPPRGAPPVVMDFDL